MRSGGTAATAVSKFYGDAQDNMAFEVFTAAFSGSDTTTTITPTKIKSIQFVSVTGTDATGVAAAVPYVSTFTPGGATCVITGATNGDYLIMVMGKIA